jgi:hypothetical protein
MAFTACIGGTITLDGATAAVTGGGFNCEAAEDDVTNLAGGGYYESVSTVKKATATVDCVFDNEAAPEFEEGDIVALALAAPSGVGITGNFRVNSMNFPILDPQKAVRYSLALTSQKAYTRTFGSAP